MVALPFRVMTRPFRAYRQLAAGAEIPSTRGGTSAPIALGAGRFLLVLGALVSVSATGRFAPAELGLAMVSFSWLPLVNAVSMALAVRIFAPTFGWKRAFAFYLQGIGPWLLLFLFFIGGVLFAPHSERPSFVLWGPLVLVAAVWSILISYALFCAGFGLARARAAVATLLFWMSNLVLILGYFLAVGQLWPIL
jgi:hypothetical protein